MLNLNQRAAALCDALAGESEALRIGVSRSDCGTRLIDCGIEVPGGLEAGRRLAEICLAGLGRVQFVPSTLEFTAGLELYSTADAKLNLAIEVRYVTGKTDRTVTQNDNPMGESKSIDIKLWLPLRVSISWHF